MCDGPCHLSIFKQCSGGLIFICEQLVYSVMEKNKDLLVDLIDIVKFTGPKLHSATLKQELTPPPQCFYADSKATQRVSKCIT